MTTKELLAYAKDQKEKAKEFNAKCETQIQKVQATLKRIEELDKE